MSVGASRPSGRELDVAVQQALWPENKVVFHGSNWVYAETISPGSDYPPEGLPLYSSDWEHVPDLLHRVRELGWDAEVADELERLAGDISGHVYNNIAEAIEGLLFYGAPLPEQICRAIVAARAGRE